MNDSHQHRKLNTSSASHGASGASRTGGAASSTGRKINRSGASSAGASTEGLSASRSAAAAFLPSCISSFMLAASSFCRLMVLYFPTSMVFTWMSISCPPAAEALDALRSGSFTAGSSGTRSPCLRIMYASNFFCWEGDSG